MDACRCRCDIKICIIANTMLLFPLIVADIFYQVQGTITAYNSIVYVDEKLFLDHWAIYFL